MEGKKIKKNKIKNLLYITKDENVQNFISKMNHIFNLLDSLCFFNLQR